MSCSLIPQCAEYGQLGAEIVYTVSQARKAGQTFVFADETEPLELVLPPGHYVVGKVTAPPSDKPGLMSIKNPTGAPARKKRPAKR